MLGDKIRDEKPGFEATEGGCMLTLTRIKIGSLAGTTELAFTAKGWKATHNVHRLKIKTGNTAAAKTWGQNTGAPEPVPQVPRPRDQYWKQNL